MKADSHVVLVFILVFVQVPIQIPHLRSNHVLVALSNLNRHVPEILSSHVQCYWNTAVQVGQDYSNTFIQVGQGCTHQEIGGVPVFPGGVDNLTGDC